MRRPRSWRRLAWVAALGLACGPVQPPAGSPAPLNACPAFPCQVYAAPPDGLPPQPTTPICSLGQCVVLQSVPASWVVVISTATDAFYAPAMTWPLYFSTLLQSTVKPVAGTATGACGSETCAALPPAVFTQGLVECDPTTARLADWYLGPQTVQLPVEATFIPQWPDASGTAVDATALGLPLSPIAAATVPDPGPPVFPGPGGGPSLVFAVPGMTGQPGLPEPCADPALRCPTPQLTYERYLLPMAPFGQAYPPDVSDIVASPDENVVLSGFDTTDEIASPLDMSPFPTFRLSLPRNEPLDGWSAYLRDETSLRRLSNLPSLTGTSPVVQLLTSHHTPDALTNAELVMEPPAGAPLPTWIFSGLNITSTPSYPTLAAPTVATGEVTSTTSGKRIAADLVFEAIDLCRFAVGESGLVHDLLSTTHEFAFSRTLSTDDGSFSVELPLGNYRVTAIPRAAGEALTVSELDFAGTACIPSAQSLQVLAQQTVRGSALLYDGRPLAGATVEAVPAACARAPSLDGLPGVDPVCLPRFASAQTDAAGAYTLSVDPGSYNLRVRPAAGSGFPWVVQPLSVTPGVSTVPVTRVPAPVYAGLTLFDPNGNPLFDTLVQVFELLQPLPSSGPPYVEIGEALTDASGHYDMYLAPPSE